MRIRLNRSRRTSNVPVRAALAALVLLVFSSLVSAAPAVNTLKRGFLKDTPGVIAINGYDPVAYFVDSKPVQGDSAFATSWNGATWKFASKEHRDMFRTNPEKYAPQYGGYCAYGVSQGHLVSVDPDQFTILDGKLYLNYDSSVQKKWLQDTQGYNKAADSQFADLLKK